MMEKPSVDEAIFVALQSFEEINRDILQNRSHSQPNTELAATLSFSDIVDCVCNPLSETSQNRLKLINTNLDYRRKYRFVVKQVAAFESPEQLAASTKEQIMSRQQDGFAIVVDDMGDGNVMVMLSLANFADSSSDITENDGATKRSQKAHIHCEGQQNIEIIHMHLDDQGRYIAVLEQHSPAASLLVKSDTHLYVTH
ncbi:hypothetical protein PN836_001750 [Ningiella sp. W23]|uniref:hypothetical protein n=1 Tax=Ningiella sp. W23 TaxID=3023715 RepID=UPI0037573B05